MKRIEHELVITEYEDGSHDIHFESHNADTFANFAAYVLLSEYKEHWIDKLPTELISKLGCPAEKEVQPNYCNSVMEPSEVFSNEDPEEIE